MFSNLNDLHVSLMLCYCLKIHIGEEELKHWQIFVYCLMDGGFKNWSTLKHEYYLQNILYFQWMQLISVLHLTGKISLNKITISMRLQQRSIILVEAQESLLFKKQL